MYDLHQTLFRLAPGLRKLVLTAIAELDPLQTCSLASDLLSLTSLERLEMSSTQGLPTVVHILSTHPNLKEVILSSDSFDSPYNPCGALPDFHWTTTEHQHAFSSLQNLSVTLPIGPGVASMLADIRKSHSLKQLVLSDGLNSDIGEDFAVRDVPSVCKEIGLHDQLQVLHLRYVSHKITMAYVEPLLRCRLLEILIIDTNCHVFLDDNDILTVATSLPLLRQFKFNLTEPHEHFEEESRLTLTSVTYLLSACPNLSDIEMLLDAVYQPPKVEEGWIPARDTLKLTIGLSLIDDIEEDYTKIVAFLQSLKIQQVIQIEAWSETLLPPHPSSHVDIPYISRWERVQRMLRGQVG